jgi:hypothetical protein
VRPKTKLLAETQPVIHFLLNEEKVKWIEDSVQQETPGARIQVEHAEAAVQQKQDNTIYAQIAGQTNPEPTNPFEEMKGAFGDSLSDLASSKEGEDGEDELDGGTKIGKISEDAKPSWVMGRFTKTVLQHVERFRPKQMKQDKLTQPVCEDAAEYYQEREKKYGSAGLRVPVVVQLQTANVTAAPAITTF